MAVEETIEVTIVLEEQEGNNQNWYTLHQSLLMLVDSPLNHTGNLRVFIRLSSGKMIKVHREIRIPRTFKRFEKLFCNFLEGHDMPIVQTKDGHNKLLQFVGDQLYKGRTAVYRVANMASRFKSPDYFAVSHKKIILVVEFGPVDFNGLETVTKAHHDQSTYSISRYPLSAALTCVKLTSAFEKVLEETNRRE